MPIAPGERFERYDVEALIGRGGMGDVYLATDTRLRRKVALKVLRADRGGPDAVARLFREARAAASLSHAHTIAIHDLGETDGTVYIVMEYVSGKPLLTYVGDDRAPMRTKLRWLVDIARALGAAHRSGIVHRDVKPSNVMITDEGSVKVLDFGLAKRRDPTDFKTQAGFQLGTPRYMAPEQLAGEEADARSDQYAFAVTAYELLSGAHPGPPGEPPLLPLPATVQPEVARAITRMLSATPADRYATMDEVADALEAASVLGSAQVATVPEHLREPDGDTMRDLAPAHAVAPATTEEAAVKAKPVVAKTMLSREVPDGLSPVREEPKRAVRDATLRMPQAPAHPPAAGGSTPPPAVTPGRSVPAPAVLASVPPKAKAETSNTLAIVVVGVALALFGLGVVAYVVAGNRAGAEPAAASASASAPASASASASAPASASESASASASASAPASAPARAPASAPARAPASAPARAPASAPARAPAPAPASASAFPRPVNLTPSGPPASGPPVCPSGTKLFMGKCETDTF